MTKSKTLSPHDFAKYFALKDEVDNMSYAICNRLMEIVFVICECLNHKKPDAIYFPNAVGDDSIGSPKINHDDELTYVFFIANGNKPQLKTKVRDYSYSIPINFMYLELNQIKNIINKEINFNKEELINSAKNKLTREELLALGID